MFQLTSIALGDMLIPLSDDIRANFIITRISGLSNLAYQQTPNSLDRMHTAGSGRDIAIVLAVKPMSDYVLARRQIAQALPMHEKIVLSAYINDESEPYAQTTCKVRNVSFDFTDEKPKIAIDLQSIYTCLIRNEEIFIQELLFGLEADLGDNTNDFTPVKATIFLTTPLAMWYNIALSSDWLSINTNVLKSNYGIEEVIEGSYITINSDDELFEVVLHQPFLESLNIETACDVGPHGFKFPPNKPMLVETTKLPSGLSGETVSISCRPRLSGV